ncbi:MAG: hypothetical protein ABSE43_13155 [Steroidobacteraceae bacterium]|jgi:hypothetical protein
MFKNTDRVPAPMRTDSSGPGRLEEMIVYAKFALQNVGGPGYDPYNSPAAAARTTAESATHSTTHPQAGD